MKKYCIILITLLLAANPATSQDYDADIAAVTARIESAKTCHIISTITVYNDKQSKKKVTSFGSELRKSDEAYRTTIAETELMSDGNVMIMVDHEEKVVQLQKLEKISKKDKAFMKEFYALNAEKDNKDTVFFLGKEGNVNTWLVKYKYGEIRQMTVSINTAENTLKRIEFEYSKKYYPDNSYVVIDYTTFSYNASFDKGLFTGRDLVSKKAGGFVLTEKYNDYELITDTE